MISWLKHRAKSHDIQYIQRRWSAGKAWLCPSALRNNVVLFSFPQSEFQRPHPHRREHSDLGSFQNHICMERVSTKTWNQIGSQKSLLCSLVQSYVGATWNLPKSNFKWPGQSVAIKSVDGWEWGGMLWGEYEQALRREMRRVSPRSDLKWMKDGRREIFRDPPLLDLFSGVM